MRRRVNILLALALVASVFAGVFGTASADHDDNAPVLGHQFLPWVPNGAELGEQGPYHGAVTVLNLEDDDAEVDVYVGQGDGWELEETVALAPKESMTLSASTLDIPEPGSSVVLEGYLQREETDDDEVTQEAIAARIAAVTKNVSPTDGSGGTTSDHEVVDGYTALDTEDVAQAAMPWSDGTYIVPIVQNNAGWETVLRVANMNQSGGFTNVTVTLYGSGTQGFAGESEVVNLQLRAGETGSVDISDHVSDEWVGSAFITSGADIAAVAERSKDVDDMLVSTTSRPEHHAAETHYGPLVFKEYNFWNTGISVANVDDEAHNSVTVSYVGPTNNIVGQDTLTIPPRGMEFIYTPGTQDLGLDSGFVGSVIVEGSHELVANIDQVKYFGDDPDVGQAMAYITEGPFEADTGQELALPLAQKGNANTGGGDTSGIQLFNRDSDDSVDADIVFYGANGVPVAPTVENNDADPIEIEVGAHSNYTLYTHAQSELSSGFEGSVIVSHEGGWGELVGVSNNVNYDVAGDGSTAFNLIRSEPRAGTDITIEQSAEEQLLGDENEVTATLRDQFGAPMPGEDVDIVVDHLVDDSFDDTFEGTTDANGQFSITYSQDSGAALGEESIWAEHDEAGTSDTLTHTWTADIALEHAPDNPDTNLVGDEHTVLATVTGFDGLQVENALVDFVVDTDSANDGVVGTTDPDETSTENRGITNASGEVTFTYTGENFGDDTILATLTELGGPTWADSVTKTWVDIEVALEPGEDVNPFYPDEDTRFRAWADQIAALDFVDADAQAVYDSITEAGSVEDYEEDLEEDYTEEQIAEITAIYEGLNHHTVDATVTVNGETVEAGVDVDFEVTGGNAADGTEETDANGVASFTYESSSDQDDSITATVEIEGFEVTSPGAVKAWDLVESEATDLTLEHHFNPETEQPTGEQNPTGHWHHMLATLYDQFGIGMQGELLTASLVSPSVNSPGQDVATYHPDFGEYDPGYGDSLSTGTPWERETNDDGQVAFSYQGEVVGEDTIQVEHDGSDVSETITKAWYDAVADSIALSADPNPVPSGSGQTTTVVTALVLDQNSQPMEDIDVVFTTSGEEDGTPPGGFALGDSSPEYDVEPRTETTDEYGEAEVPHTMRQTHRPDSVTVTGTIEETSISDDVEIDFQQD